MDYLLTAIAIALVCFAGWLIYKRWVGRYRQQPREETEDYEEEAEAEETEGPEVQKAVAEPPTPEEKKDV
jgi:flagellar biosynthesis/type III secretory pathway M-ring protein FliF/YscJ